VPEEQWLPYLEITVVLSKFDECIGGSVGTESTENDLAEVFQPSETWTTDSIGRAEDTDVFLKGCRKIPTLESAVRLLRE
jgi:hypothetical protein